MYARRRIADDVIESQIGRPLPDGVGPPIEPPPPEEGIEYRLLTQPIDWHGAPSETSVLLWNNGVLAWHEAAALAEVQAGAIEAIDAAGEALRMAILSLPTQSEEYRRVEVQARAWAAAGYPEGEGIDVPRGVTGWAQAKWRDGWTNRQACDDILATADVWLSVLDTIRDLRLLNKEDVRHAATPEETRAIVSDMRADMQALARQLNLTLTE